MSLPISEQLARAFVVSLTPLLLIVLVIKGAAVWCWIRRRSGR